MTTHEREDQLFLVRHGETEWSKSGRHTSVTDLPLTPEGERVAASLKERLAGETFDLVLTSPRQRARRTAELAGFPDAEVDDDLVEWDYGDYEGITTAEIRKTVPGWTVWADPVPNGETPAQVAARLDRVNARIAAVPGDVLVFGHSHALRAPHRPLARTRRHRRPPLRPQHRHHLGPRLGTRLPAIHHWNNCSSSTSRSARACQVIRCAAASSCG